MSTPGNTDTPTFEQQVNEAAGKMTKGEDGNWTFPEDLQLSDEVKFAAGLEKRRRDTQSSYSKSQQELAQAKAVNEALENQWEQDFSVSYDDETRAELEELKATDPDKWLAKIQELQSGKKDQFNERKAAVAKEAKTKSEAETRAEQLAAWQEANPNITLNDDVLDNDLPPRLTKQLENGEIAFGDFLDKAGEYLSKGKVVEAGGDPAPDAPNLGDLPGSDHPSSEAQRNSQVDKYEEEIY